MKPSTICFWLLKHRIALLPLWPLSAKAGSNMAARTHTQATTARTSISVSPLHFAFAESNFMVCCKVIPYVYSDKLKFGAGKVK